MGDGGNDLELFRITDHGITFADSSDTIKQSALYTITTLKDLETFFMITDKNNQSNLTIINDS